MSPEITAPNTAAQKTVSALGHETSPRRALLSRAIAHGGDLLPAQGPITAFVFLNTLQALEDLPFDEGVRRGADCSAAIPT